MSRKNIDWKAQLNGIKKDMVKNMSVSEKEALEKEKQEEKRQIIEFNKRKKKMYQFLAGYKQNSGIFINNFMRGRDYETYCKDKFHNFDFVTFKPDKNCFSPNVFDDEVLSLQMIRYLGQLEELKIAYHPITVNFVDNFIAFAEIMDILEPLKEDTILYRGCSTLDRNGVNGIVSTTTNKTIAEQYSRGTILTMHVPKGTKYIDINTIRPRNRSGQVHDYENEILLPPCDYTILSEKEVKSHQEPNNCTGTTKQIDLEIKPLDLLTEFATVMKDPPLEYNQVIKFIESDHYEALKYLETYIKSRDKNNHQKVFKKN